MGKYSRANVLISIRRLMYSELRKLSIGVRRKSSRLGLSGIARLGRPRVPRRDLRRPHGTKNTPGAQRKGICNYLIMATIS